MMRKEKGGKFRKTIDEPNDPNKVTKFDEMKEILV